MWIDRRVLMILGGISLLLNVFLIGIVIGHVVAGRPRQLPAVAPGPLVHLKALSPEDRRMFAAGMNTHRPTIRAARMAHRSARLATEADIAATTFDRAKVVADFEELRRSNRGVDEAVDAALVDALANLPPEARAAIVSRDRAVKAPPTPQ